MLPVWKKLRDKEAGTSQFILMDVTDATDEWIRSDTENPSACRCEEGTDSNHCRTANAFEEDRKHALDAGMDGFIMKPFRVDEMMKVIGEVME